MGWALKEASSDEGREFIQLAVGPDDGEADSVLARTGPPGFLQWILAERSRQAPSGYTHLIVTYGRSWGYLVSNHAVIGGFEQCEFDILAHVGGVRIGSHSGRVSVALQQQPTGSPGEREAGQPVARSDPSGYT
jgi:hypothetical protein